MKIGILALQGAVSPHEKALKQIGVESLRVKTPEHLREVDGIILPGGESTTMIHMLKRNKLWEDLKSFVQEKPTWGICAGAILLAKDVDAPKQESLEAIDISIERNAYGRQNESFISEVNATEEWNGEKTTEAVFIRAPRIRRLGKNVRTLFVHEKEPVVAESDNILVTTFHPELSATTALHEYFVKKYLN